MFVGWEGVGLCSYLLVGYYFDREYAAAAGRKAFVVNRIGDYGFLLGMFGIFATFGSLNYSEVFRKAAEQPAHVQPGAGGHLPLPLHRRDGQERAGARSTSGCRTRWRARRPSRP